MEGEGRTKWRKWSQCLANLCCFCNFWKSLSYSAAPKWLFSFVFWSFSNHLAKLTMQGLRGITLWTGLGIICRIFIISFCEDRCPAPSFSSTLLHFRMVPFFQPHSPALFSLGFSQDLLQISSFSRCRWPHNDFSQFFSQKLLANQSCGSWSACGQILVLVVGQRDEKKSTKRIRGNVEP